MKYQDTYRRSLLDMHIPDWNPKFLSKYDPRQLAELYAGAGVQGALIYAKSHMGLCYWPTPVGGIHRIAKTRDIVAETIQALQEHEIRPAIYHSLVFDNWAAENHPSWRQLAPQTAYGEANTTRLGARYGTLCVNNPEYVDYEIAQISALVDRYDVDAFWFDMVFWGTVCICACCQKRTKNELGFDLPSYIDWFDPHWNLFQAARARWLDEFWENIRNLVLKHRPEAAIAHNLAPELSGWAAGASTDEVIRDTFAAGDLYGGRDEQLFVSRLMHTLTRKSPAEYMTTRSPGLRHHVQTRSERDLLLHALGSVAQHLALLFIDSVDPVGTIDPNVYKKVAGVFEFIRPYQENLGGNPVNDVALYFSPGNRVPRVGDRQLLRDRSEAPIPYEEALSGAIAALQSMHISFGVVTRSTIDSLCQYRVLILTDVERLDESEIGAIRDFVHAGGRVYASGNTSFRNADGTTHADGGLFDVFGMKSCSQLDFNVVFVNPVDPRVQASIAPDRLVAWGLPSGTGLGSISPHLDLWLPDVVPEAEILATLTLPFGHPHKGTLEGHDFASIHSSPPWTDTSEPLVFRHRVGDGECIYSAVPLEAVQGSARSMFCGLIDSLIGGSKRLVVNAPPAVWVTLFDQPERSRMIASILNYEEQPLMKALVEVSIAAPPGRRISGVTRTTQQQCVPHSISKDGSLLKIEALEVALFEQLEIKLEVEQ